MWLDEVNALQQSLVPIKQLSQDHILAESVIQASFAVSEQTAKKERLVAAVELLVLSKVRLLQSVSLSGIIHRELKRNVETQ